MTDDPQDTATPILDFNAPLPSARDESYTWPQKLGIAAVYGAGILIPGISLQEVRRGPAPGQYSGDFAFFISVVFIGTPIVWLFVTLIHEIGHLAVGLLLGFHFEAMEVGAMRLERRGGWKIRSCRPFNLLGGGRTEMVLNRMQHIRRRLIYLYLGGPLATIFLLLVTLRILLEANNPPVFIGAMCLLSCGVLHLLTSLLPVSLASEWGDWNDFRFLKALVKSKKEARRMVTASALQMVKRRGLDPVLCNPRWLEIAYGAEYWRDWTEYLSSTVDSIKANHLERWLRESGRYRNEERDGLLIEAAFFWAWHRSDAEKATVWFRRVSHHERISAYARLRVETSFCCARHEYQQALLLCEQGIELLRQCRRPWVRKYEEKWILWQSQIEARRINCAQASSLPAN